MTAIPPLPRGYKIAESAEELRAAPHFLNQVFSEWVRLHRHAAENAIWLQEHRGSVFAVPDPAFDWRVDATLYWRPILDLTHTGEMGDADLSREEATADLAAKLADAEARCERLREELVRVAKGLTYLAANGDEASALVAKIERGEP